MRLLLKNVKVLTGIVVKTFFNVMHLYEIIEDRNCFSNLTISYLYTKDHVNDHRYLLKSKAHNGFGCELDHIVAEFVYPMYNYDRFY